MKTKALMYLISWVFAPSDKFKLFKILEDLTDDELVFAARRIDGAAGRLAWAEFARRRKFFDFEIGVSASEGKLKVQFKAKAPPVHETPTFDRRNKC